MWSSAESEAEGEKVWRELCKNDQVVVLADGLEEALIEGNARKERDNLLRLAIRRANEQKLPLIITSRPHDPLRDMEAAIVELEPLSEEAALEYVQEHGGREDDRRLDWVVETADVAETPFYLQVTRQLDRAELRLRLLDSWVHALVDGHFPAGLALSREDRLATVEQLSLLACIGLRWDRLQVRFDDAEAMLAEARGNGLRFPHTIMQAYLASRLIDAAMGDETYRRHALTGSGRELLIALILNSRAKMQVNRPRDQVTRRTGAATRSAAV